MKDDLSWNYVLIALAIAWGMPSLGGVARQLARIADALNGVAAAIRDRP